MKSSLVLSQLSCTLLYLATLTRAQSCGPSPSGDIRPSIASGYRMQVVATGLSKPRGIILDSEGNLLVVEQGRGVVSAHVLTEENGCVSVSSSSDITAAIDLNHGIEVSEDGNTLYASTSNEAYAWNYDSSARTVSNRRTLVRNMATQSHPTRTLLLSRSAPGMLVIPKGSTSNLDFNAADISSGSSQVKAFNISNVTDGYDYNTDGLLLGWGLRNEVGIAEHPNSGGIWGVENSADEILRYGVDIHQDNPGEELNFLGYLDGTPYARQGTNFGYPWCFSAWNVESLPNNGNLSIGDQFALDPSTALDDQNRTDVYCAAQTQARLVFQAHMAPLDIKFNDTGRQAWVAFHGSWDRTDPVGYKVSVVEFGDDGEPVEPLTSLTAATDIFANADTSACPNDCFRPVAMAIDQQGRIFVSSDSSGEIYLLSRDEASSGGATPTSSSSPTSTSASTSPTDTSEGSTSTSASGAASATPSNAAYILAPPSTQMLTLGACLAPFVAMLI